MANTETADRGPKAQDITQFRGKKRRLLEALLDPENKKMSITELCTQLGISRRYYYDCTEDPNFTETLLDQTKKMLTRYLPRMAQSMVEQGLAGEPRMVRTVFETLGLIGPKSVQTVNVANYPVRTEPLQFDNPHEALAYLKAEQADRAGLIAMFEAQIAGESQAETEPVNVERIGPNTAFIRLEEPKNEG